MNITCPWENELKLMQYSENKQLSPDLKEPHASCQEFYCTHNHSWSQSSHNKCTQQEHSGDHSAFASPDDHSNIQRKVQLQWNARQIWPNLIGYVTSRKGNTSRHMWSCRRSQGLSRIMHGGMPPVTSAKFDMISVRPWVIFPKVDFSFPHNFIYT